MDIQNTPMHCQTVISTSDAWLTKIPAFYTSSSTCIDHEAFDEAEEAGTS